MSDGYGGGPVPPGATAGPESLRPPGSFGQPAAFGARAGAAIIDFVVKLVFAIGILAVVGSITGIGFLAGDETSGFWSFVVAAIMGLVTIFFVSLLYEPLYMNATNGKTIGKQVTGCRVVRLNGQRMDFGWALLREVGVKWLGFNVIGNSITLGLPVATLVDCLWALWDPHRRALHDIIVQTRVIVD